jgi:hypothetical protein
MTDLERVRNLIGDQHKSDVVRLVGDGTSVLWQLVRKRLKTDSVTYSGDTVIAVDEVNYNTGLVTLASAPDDGELFSISCEYSAFRDEELEDYLASGSVKSVALECIQVLMADAARRYDYSTGIEEFNPSQVFEHLKDLKKALQESDVSLASSGGAVVKTRTSQYGNLNKLYESPWQTG